MKAVLMLFSIAFHFNEQMPKIALVNTTSCRIPVNLGTWDKTMELISALNKTLNANIRYGDEQFAGIKPFALHVSKK